MSAPFSTRAFNRSTFVQDMLTDHTEGFEVTLNFEHVLFIERQGDSTLVVMTGYNNLLVNEPYDVMREAWRKEKQHGLAG